MISVGNKRIARVLSGRSLTTAAFIKDETAQDFIPEYLKALKGQSKITKAFVDEYNLLNLRELTIPKNITTIESGAFTGDKKITTLRVPSHLAYYRNFDFNYIDGYYYSNITNLYITPGNTASMSTYSGFYKCLPLRNIYVDAPLDGLGNEFARGCINLKHIFLPSTIQWIRGYALDGIDDVSIHLKSLEQWFQVSRDSIYVGITDSYNLYINGNLLTELKADDFEYGITNLSSISFKLCRSLRKVSLPDTITKIGSSVFSDCENLSEISLPASLTELEYTAFRNSGLTSIIIPKTLQTIRDEYGTYSNNYINPFVGCNKLEEIIVEPDNRYFSSPNNSALMHYTTLLSGLSSSFIPQNAKNLGVYAFSGIDIANINIPNGVTTINKGAFSLCSKLTSITIPNSVTSIGEDVFQNCSGLTSVTIPDSVTSIGNYVFYGCSGLSSVTIPNSVKSIGDSAFSRCSGLTSITIPDSVTSIGAAAFNSCSNLDSVYITDFAKWLKISFGSNSNYRFQSNPLYYANNLYLNNELITSITIPDSITSISDKVFCGWKNLLSITIPDSVTSIGSYAFSGCSGLTSISIPDSVTGVGSYAFQNCSGLTSVTIPDSVTSIGNYVFYGCSGLSSVTIPNSVKSIGDSAFSRCSGLTSITIPTSVTSIGRGAFSHCSGLTDVTVGENFNSSLAIEDGTYTSDVMVNIFINLKDLTGATSKKLTLGTKNLTKLTDAQKTIATNKNWVLE